MIANQGAPDFAGDYSFTLEFLPIKNDFDRKPLILLAEKISQEELESLSKKGFSFEELTLLIEYIKAESSTPSSLTVKAETFESLVYIVDFTEEEIFSKEAHNKNEEGEKIPVENVPIATKKSSNNFFVRIESKKEKKEVATFIHNVFNDKKSVKTFPSTTSEGDNFRPFLISLMSNIEFKLSTKLWTLQINSDLEIIFIVKSKSVSKNELSRALNLMREIVYSKPKVKPSLTLEMPTFEKTLDFAWLDFFPKFLFNLREKRFIIKGTEIEEVQSFGHFLGLMKTIKFCSWMKDNFRVESSLLVLENFDKLTVIFEQNDVIFESLQKVLSLYSDMKHVTFLIKENMGSDFCIEKLRDLINMFKKESTVCLRADGKTNEFFYCLSLPECGCQKEYKLVARGFEIERESVNKIKFIFDEQTALKPEYIEKALLESRAYEITLFFKNESVLQRPDIKNINEIIKKKIKDPNFRLVSFEVNISFDNNEAIELIASFFDSIKKNKNIKSSKFQTEHVILKNLVDLKISDMEKNGVKGCESYHLLLENLPELKTFLFVYNFNEIPIPIASRLAKALGSLKKLGGLTLMFDRNNEMKMESIFELGKVFLLSEQNTLRYQLQSPLLTIGNNKINVDLSVNTSTDPITILSNFFSVKSKTLNKSLSIDIGAAVVEEKKFDEFLSFLTKTNFKALDLTIPSASFPSQYIASVISTLILNPGQKNISLKSEFVRAGDKKLYLTVGNDKNVHDLVDFFKSLKITNIAKIEIRFEESFNIDRFDHFLDFLDQDFDRFTLNLELNFSENALFDLANSNLMKRISFSRKFKLFLTFLRSRDIHISDIDLENGIEIKMESFRINNHIFKIYKNLLMNYGAMNKVEVIVDDSEQSIEVITTLLSRAVPPKLLSIKKDQRGAFNTQRIEKMLDISTKAPNGTKISVDLGEIIMNAANEETINTTLVYTNAQWNQKRTSEIVASMIKNRPRLKELVISITGLSNDSDIRNISTSVEKCDQLQSFQLKFNVRQGHEITIASVQKLFQSLARKKALMKIEIVLPSMDIGQTLIGFHRFYNSLKSSMDGELKHSVSSLVDLDDLRTMNITLVPGNFKIITVNTRNERRELIVQQNNINSLEVSKSLMTSFVKTIKGMCVKIPSLTSVSLEFNQDMFERLLPDIEVLLVGNESLNKIQIAFYPKRIPYIFNYQMERDLDKYEERLQIMASLMNIIKLKKNCLVGFDFKTNSEIYFDSLTNIYFLNTLYDLRYLTEFESDIQFTHGALFQNRWSHPNTNSIVGELKNAARKRQKLMILVRNLNNGLKRSLKRKEIRAELLELLS